MNDLSSTVTMSSREIADLVESRHDNVKITIERLVSRGVIASPATQEKPTGGRPAVEYLVGKRDSFVIVAQLSPEFTARLVDRWQELEEQVQRIGALPSTSAVNDLLLIGRAVSQVPGVNPGIAMSLTLDTIESYTGLPASGLRKALPGTGSAAAVKMNATQLGERVGISARATNKALREIGLQSKDDNGNWILTDAGQQHGEMIPYTRNGHSDYQVHWHESVIPVLRASLDTAKVLPINKKEA
ncbi:Rha family transcriptional regulator [Paraburkholderia hospita]|uniref:Rha family transcriptional regulator n=1 Tax=Paraburkholderia hospita TaxID=169430 RepID=UPI000B344498|nr:Rha family transcriptional regulator [Paraburkholderia hospita]OUL79968.1 hypothetical protein CA603_32765 [Paraburkholderia hospita]